MELLQVGKDCKTKCREMPEREMNSDREGGRPSCFATAAMEFKTCRLFGMLRTLLRHTNPGHSSERGFSERMRPLGAAFLRCRSESVESDWFRKLGVGRGSRPGMA